MEKRRKQDKMRVTVLETFWSFKDKDMAILLGLNVGNDDSHENTVQVLKAASLVRGVVEHSNCVGMQLLPNSA